MSLSQPIRQIENIEKLKKFFLEKNEIRNYALITMGLNTALRIGDILQLKWKDVYIFERQSYKKHICIEEKKTGKYNSIALNSSVIESLEILKRSVSGNFYPEYYLFQSRNGENRHISRSWAFRIIKRAAVQLHMEENISCHSLRKTFGYQAWKNGVPPAVIMSIFNHSSMEVTKRYLSIDQDDKDEVFYNLKL